MSRKELPRADMTIEGAQVSHGEEESSDEDVEDEAYVLSPRAPPHSKGKGLTSGSGSMSTTDQVEIQEESRHEDDATQINEEETFDVEEIIP
jgi:hypothetical protein